MTGYGSKELSAVAGVSAAALGAAALSRADAAALVPDVTAENVAIYPSEDGDGEWVFQVNIPTGATPEWTLTPLDGDAVAFEGRRVTRPVAPGQYSVHVSVGDAAYSTDIIVGSAAGAGTGAGGGGSQ